MITTSADITDVRIDGTEIWIELKVQDKHFPVHHQFDVSDISGYSKIAFIIKIAKVENVKDLIGRSVRVIDSGESHSSLISIGHPKKNRFIDLNRGDDFPVREWRIYWRYHNKKPHV